MVNTLLAILIATAVAVLLTAFLSTFVLWLMHKVEDIWRRR
jgi:hypothetical protein